MQLKLDVICSVFVSCFLFHFINMSANAAMLGPSLLFTNDTDHLALLAIKGEIIGDPFQVLKSWNDSVPFCEWQGISCSPRHQRVTMLSLPSLSLKGTLSPYIGNLSFLRVVNLTGNSFSGNVPEEVGRLFRLRNLILVNNSFEGEIPASLSNCSELRTIGLSMNLLSGEIPPEISSVSKLVSLNLARNRLIGTIPSSLGNLTALTDLSLDSNHLEGRIPPEIGLLSNLQSLNLYTNLLSGAVPNSLFNLSSLLTFDVSNNSFEGQLPHDFGLNLPNLQKLNLGGNQFFGPIPSTILNASRLRDIDFTQNGFVGQVPTNFGMLKDLETLQLSINPLGTENSTDDLGFISSLSNCTNMRMLIAVGSGLKGQFPDSIANLSSNLTFLGLSNNSISGNIPEGIGNLVNLIYLGLADNMLTGIIPGSVTKLAKLQRLLMHNNSISGQIPSHIGNLSQLSSLSLWGNSLEGRIPTSLGACSRLQQLDISYNKLSGPIPEQVMSLPSLSLLLYLSGNQLTGPLPVQVGSLKSLRAMFIEDNKLSGEIPSTLGDCVMLDSLDLKGNMLEGNIPSSLSNLRNLRILDLSKNNLSGQIPKSLSELKSLSQLNFSFNILDGEVPTEGVFSNISKFSAFGNHKLCGGIRLLQLPSCPKQITEKDHRRSGRALLLYIAGPIACAILLSLCFCAFLYWKRHSKRVHAPVLPLINQHVEVTYADLLQATEGFSSANLIGEGSFGSVYKGTLIAGEMFVAVKVFHLQASGANKSFFAECEALKNIRHRNLVKIISACSSITFQGEDFKALVYEFMPNGSLENWLHPVSLELPEIKNLNFRQRFSIAMDVAEALDYLHHQCQTPVLHCDLKPSNILLDANLTAHVADFGLARFLLGSAGHSQTFSTGLRGTIGYAAPEYGTGSKASTQGDMYSYGILLFELFTGRRPTDNMFTDNLSLHVYVRMAFPDQVMRVIDPQLILHEAQGETSSGYRSTERSNVPHIENCLASILRIGILCSAELPAERISIQDVLREFHGIKKSFLSNRRENTRRVS
ncbi:hypothetical protein K2173_009535 [Erythroxylum novogranatense]|uniref:non-specific serine/threonine protein kinase n=1 Tax=Erythroxylum novogranatense TaxID=1862640 RepID=A0AAV8U7N4_9ROSI|nr:hypothetical protein K2173_009535 [Erythroxylum novogranatense]